MVDIRYDTMFSYQGKKGHPTFPYLSIKLNWTMGKKKKDYIELKSSGKSFSDILRDVHGDDYMEKLPKEMRFMDENGNWIPIHSKATIRMITKPDFNFEYLDEDGFPMTTGDDIRDFNRRMRKLDKEEFLNQKNVYNLSRWGQEVVNILSEKGKMKNADIMNELWDRDLDTQATHIKDFFKTDKQKQFYKKQLVNNKSYWSLKDDNKAR